MTVHIFKILIVDDNPKNLQVLGSILQKAQYTVAFASNAGKAMEILRESPEFDLVLLDINMPVMNGYDMCKIMKSDPVLKDIPVIFLTAYTGMENVLTGFEIGGQDYITKPFNEKELLARVNTQLQLKYKTEQLKYYARELEIQNATKDKFYSIIAHDLRNPFSGIHNLSKILLKTIDKTEVNELKERMQTIVSAAENGSKLLENLLAWAKSQTGNIIMCPVNTSPAEIADACIAGVNAQASAKNISIVNNIPADIELSTDEELLMTILRNLLTNAIKYSHEHGKIEISGKCSDSCIEIAVADRGIGISREILNDLFRIESKVQSKPGTAKESGSGLGLILCKEFAEKLHGRINVESEEGKGSTFRLILPLEFDSIMVSI